ncbi:TPA: hypothetical protein BOS_6607 [Bos taurus]|nr:TPA: hypothetical protein BOS_6607 [Bos taurus]
MILFVKQCVQLLAGGAQSPCSVLQELVKGPTELLTQKDHCGDPSGPTSPFTVVFTQKHLQQSVKVQVQGKMSLRDLTISEAKRTRAGFSLPSEGWRPEGGQKDKKEKYKTSGYALAALGCGTRPRGFTNPAAPGSLGAEVRQVATVPGAAKSGRTESDTQLCCGTRAAGLAAPAAEPRCPHAWRLSPPPRAWRKRPRRGAGAPGQGAGGGRGASGAARGLALPASRCGGRGVLARVTAPPARPPPGCRRRAGSRRGGKQEAPRLGQEGEDWSSRAGKEAGDRAPPPASAPQLRCPRAKRVQGTAVGWAAGPGSGVRTISSEPRLSGTSLGTYPERQVFSSGFYRLDLAPACGRLKGNQKLA